MPALLWNITNMLSTSASQGCMSGKQWWEMNFRSNMTDKYIIVLLNISISEAV